MRGCGHRREPETRLLWQAEEAEKQLQKEAEDELRRAAQKEARATAAREYQEADWIRDSEAPDSGSEEEAPQLSSIECELCEKWFKSEAAFQNHKRCAVSLHQGTARSPEHTYRV